MRGGDSYVFLQIKDAMACLYQKVNLIGVVIEYGIPRRSMGTDFFCSLKIMDESSPGIVVNMFAESMDKLPHVVCVDDIILLSQVVIKNHGHEVNAVFNKKFSAFALFKGKNCKDFNPYQVSDNFRSRNKDKKFIAGVREWLADYVLASGCKECRLLREIKESECVELICKILHKCEVAKDEWVIFVWDGTDTPPINMQTKLGEEEENPLPLQLGMPVSIDILRMFPTVGTVLRVTCSQGNGLFGIHLLDIGKWVRFVNIICEVHMGLWHGVFKPFTKIDCIADEDPLVLKRQSTYDNRMSSKWERMPFTSFPWPSCITVSNYEHVSFVTLMDVLTFPKALAKFRCVVRVVAVYPWMVKDFCSPSGVYRIRLTLEDPTARIHAFLYAEDGEEFFQGHPAVEVLTKKRNKLLGVIESEDGKTVDAPRNPPWVECCLHSQYPVDTDSLAGRNYRIFGTQLVG